MRDVRYARATAFASGDVRLRHRMHWRHRRHVLGVVLLLLCAFWTATGAATATPAQASPQAADDTSQAAHLADRLRTNPVYVTDQLPREIPHSTAPDFARLAKRTGVPTYVLVLPGQSTTNGEALLGAVHDRLGRDGLYVLVDYMGVTNAVAFGVRAPAADAETATLYELPYDAGPLRSFERFAEVVAQGGEKAAARAEAAREKYGSDGGEEPEQLYIGPADRENQSFLTGILLVGVPLLILLLAAFVRRWRRRLPSARAAKPGSTKPGAAASRVPRGAVAGVALLTAVAIALGAWLTFDQTTSSAARTPTAADLSARVERVAKGLKQDPVYADPESPQVLDAGEKNRLRDRISEFGSSRSGGPVFVSVVPQMYEDESAGDAYVFAEAVHAKVGRDGVYVVADPLEGDISVVSYGLRLDNNHLLFDLPDSISDGDDSGESGESDGYRLSERLDRLMTFLDKTPRTDAPNSPDPDLKPEPIESHALRPLFSGDFWPGLLVGAFAALLVFAIVAGVLGIVGAVLRRRNPAPLPTAALPFEAPTDPSTAYLRRTARTELGELARMFTEDQVPNPVGTGTGTGAEALAGVRAWDCFDAAMLLVDGDIDAFADDGVDPASLVAVIVLARAGRAAFAGDTNNLCCGLNPLHGPAVSRHHVRVSGPAETVRRRLLPVCQPCRETAIVEPSTVHTLRMTLPPGQEGQGDGERMPYEEVAGPLPAVRNGIPQLIDKVREFVSVR
ncbi:hypothetical protein [Streptomyces sporangiiformans]|uniref:Uncharacterized protein n=2 Tax=Streptomyces sporangiiformans TaxID=2315329 RepID=A0A505DJ13_9ACTN|nr:hypothetical protein [Streptomyces sporangiiformans]TPQ22065.1 hypothetical protein FGD71_011765 [Streptomyces sporangiiformans]